MDWGGNGLPTSVTLYDTHNDKAPRGGKLTLYQVATVKAQNGNLSYYTGDFTGCGRWAILTDSTLADRLQEYLPKAPAIAAQQTVMRTAT